MAAGLSVPSPPLVRTELRPPAGRPEAALTRAARPANTVSAEMCLHHSLNGDSSYQLQTKRDGVIVLSRQNHVSPPPLRVSAAR